ncbi:hypothetical protein, partial [Nonlabens sp.]|uniref:hypothetical protein n=1 Tax=Nonlabens sp. TaxID=1888209 RepID=UPI0039E63F2B
KQQSFRYIKEGASDQKIIGIVFIPMVVISYRDGSYKHKKLPSIRLSYTTLVEVVANWNLNKKKPPAS